MSLHLLDTTLVEHPEFDGSDVDREIAALFQRQVLIDRIAHGEADWEELGDLLSDQGYDGEDYLESVDQKLTLFFESDPAVSGGLYLP
jgi:hypothetical protein